VSYEKIISHIFEEFAGVSVGVVWGCTSLIFFFDETRTVKRKKFV